jgi:hypothetical protein
MPAETERRLAAGVSSNCGGGGGDVLPPPARQSSPLLRQFLNCPAPPRDATRPRTSGGPTPRPDTSWTPGPEPRAPSFASRWDPAATFRRPLATEAAHIRSCRRCSPTRPANLAPTNSSAPKLRDSSGVGSRL